MENKLTIIISGNKESGKTTLLKFIFAEFINNKIGTDRFSVEKHGKDVFIVDNHNNNRVINPCSVSKELENLSNAYSVKIYNFDDAIKEFIINIFGIDKEQCYGTNEDKNTTTHIQWEGFPKEIREKFIKKKKDGRYKHGLSGSIKINDLIEVFGNSICKKIDENCWARGLYSKIQRDGYELAIIESAKNPNEISIGGEIGHKSIRLLKNPKSYDIQDQALKDFSLGEFSLVVPNQDMTPEELWSFCYMHVKNWFKNHSIIK